MEGADRRVVIDVDEGALRRGSSEDERTQAEMIEMRPSAATGCGWCSIAPTRGLIGYQARTAHRYPRAPRS